MPDPNATSFARSVTFSDSNEKGDGAPLKKVVSYSRVWWKFKMRDDDDDDDV